MGSLYCFCPVRSAFSNIVSHFLPPPHSEIKKERPPTPDDVIVLSDNEPGSPQINGIGHSLKKTDAEMLMVIFSFLLEAFAVSNDAQDCIVSINHCFGHFFFF